MEVDVSKTLRDSITAPFRDMQLLLVLVLWGIVVFAISYLLIPSIINAVYSLSSIASSSPTMIVGSLFSLLSIVAVLMIASIIIGVFFTNMVLAKAFYGRKYSLEDAARFAVSRYLSVFGTEVLLFILFLVVPALVISVVIIASAGLGILLLFLYMIFAIYAVVKLSVSVPAALVGKKNPVEALRYSWNITTRQWWTLFATFLVIFVIIMIITYIVGLPLNNGITRHIEIGMTSNVSSALRSFRSPSFAVADLITQVVQIVIQSWLLISAVLIYGQLASKTKNSK